MKNNYRKLAVLLAWFPDAFYSISISEYGISMQGKYNPVTVIKAGQMRFALKADSNGYIELVREDIEIILTD